MILMATFVPSIESNSFDLSQECMKAFISLGDVIGLYYLFQAKRTSYMAALIGLSWATTESLLRRLIPLCIEARSMQFSWRHTLTAVEANISIVTHISFAVLIWAWNRKPGMWRKIATLLVGQKFLFPVVTRCCIPLRARPRRPLLASGVKLLHLFGARLGGGCRGGSGADSWPMPSRDIRRPLSSPRQVATQNSAT